MSSKDSFNPFNWVGSAVSTAFNWLGDNPEITASLLTSYGTNYNARKMQEKEWERLDLMEERRRPKYASMDSYTGQLTADGGLLTNGLLANLKRR